jgi:hypothetical protein
MRIKTEIGITTGHFSNFPANQDYMKKYVNVFFAGPYIRTGRHEFTIGMDFPLSIHALSFSDKNINPCAGAVAGYKFYIFNPAGRENLFIHYSFQYLRFKGNFDTYPEGSSPLQWTETDTYINNIIGVGYTCFLIPMQDLDSFITLIT